MVDVDEQGLGPRTEGEAVGAGHGPRGEFGHCGAVEGEHLHPPSRLVGQGEASPVHGYGADGPARLGQQDRRLLERSDRAITAEGAALQPGAESAREQCVAARQESHGDGVFALG